MIAVTAKIGVDVIIRQFATFEDIHVYQRTSLTKICEPQKPQNHYIMQLRNNQYKNNTNGAVLLSKSLIELGRNQLDKFLPSPFCLLYQAIQGNQPSIFRIRRTITFSEQFYPNSIFNTSLINSIKCKFCGYSFTSSLMSLGLTRTEP